MADMEGKTEKVPRSASSSSQIHSQDLVDRINDLPDPILSHILSLLSTKNSVATSVLSQRWKFLWRAVSDFDFCNADTLGLGKLEDIDDDSKIDWDLRDSQIEANLVKFTEFVNNVLLLRTAGSINNFSLVWEAQSISSDVSSWINTAIANNVQNLFLDIYSRNPALLFEPPQSIFSCESLRSLELKCSVGIHSANVVSLPRLETLKLSIRFEDEEAFQKLILGCPVLKSLCIYTLIIDYKDTDEDRDEDSDEDIEEDLRLDKNVFKFMVYSTTLRRLELEVIADLPATCYCSLEIEAPSLEVLKLKNCISRIFLQGSLSSLLDVHFEINASVIGGDDIAEYSCEYVIEALQAFNCAKSLTVSNHVMRALGEAYNMELNTEFKRLKKFWMMDDYGFWVTLQDSIDFIQYSDNLENLIFDKRIYIESKGEGVCWVFPDHVPKCLMFSLKTVLFYAFEGYKDEMAMLEYLLKHGSVLLVVHVHVRVEPCYDHTKKLEMLQRISKFPRKSPACQLHFF